MRALTVLMPVAGLGARFKSAGESISKPLIEVNGRPMFLEALESLNSLSPVQLNLVFVCRKTDPLLETLVAEILKHVPSANIFTLDDVSRGAAETCYLAREYIELSDPLLIMDCDIRFFSEELEMLILNQGTNTCDGALVTFSSKDARYSYVVVRDNFAVKTAEKKVISDHAIIGAYFFSRGEFFIEACGNLLSETLSDTRLEYYVSEVYNFMIKGGKKIRVFSGSFSSFGTPDELRLFKRLGE